MLSIIVITMNRADQLMEALESCARCKLPELTEFVILNNASTDHTEKKVKEFTEAYPAISVRYFYSETNLGVGGGRSYAFDKANGKYLYFMDDDAIIDPECSDQFFINSIAFLERHANVASLTTKITDALMGEQRNSIASPHVFDGKKLMYFFLGGSHFLRKASFQSPLYLNIKYSSEEYAPSIQAIDHGYCHVFDDSIRIIHKPKVNKWINGTERMRNIQIALAAVVYATKRILYPRVFHPLLWGCYQLRCAKYLRPYRGAQKEANTMVRQIIHDNPRPKVKIGTVLYMFKMFGMTVF